MMLCAGSGILTRCSIDTRDSTPQRTSLPTALTGECCEIEAGDESAIVFLTGGRTGLHAA